MKRRQIAEIDREMGASGIVRLTPSQHSPQSTGTAPVTTGLLSDHTFPVPSVLVKRGERVSFCSY